MLLLRNEAPFLYGLIMNWLQVEEAGDGLLLQYMYDLRAGMCTTQVCVLAL